MRRKDREIADRNLIEDILNEAQSIRLAMCDGDVPYIVSLCFGYENGKIYFHCALEGRKLDILRKNNRVAFQVESGLEMITGDKACDWSIKYKSVVGSGRAFFIEDAALKKDALNAIMRKYSGRESFEYSEKAVEKTALIKIVVEEMTGKKSGY